MPHSNLSKRWPIPFEHPGELLIYADKSIISGEVKIYPWQLDRLKSFGRPRLGNDDVVKIALIAANGSGKSQFVLAPCLLWMLLAFDDSLTIMTTASGEQLDTQAFRYTKRLAEKFNEIHRQDYPDGVFEIQYRKIRCLVTGSHLDMFATDEPGKAEGRHPIEVNGEFAIVVDEAKTVKDDIFNALERCTGFTRRMDLSSPGDCSGYFYDICTHAETPYDIKKVTAFDCPHLSQREIAWKITKHGISDPLIRSSIFAEFTSTQDSVVITREMLKANGQYRTIDKLFGKIRAGLDLSAGGDEVVLSVWHGNVQIAQETCRIKDTAQAVKEIISWIQKHNIDPKEIWGDDGGVGRSMLDNLREKGYTINRILNQSRAGDPTRYANRGTELWFNFKRFVESYQVKFLGDTILANQLGNRYYRVQPGTGKIILESKAEARKKGHPSPDRADACVLAWCQYIFPAEQLGDGSIPANLAPTGISVDEMAQLLRRNATKTRSVDGNIKDGRYIDPDKYGNFSQSTIMKSGQSRTFGGKRRFKLN